MGDKYMIRKSNTTIIYTLLFIVLTLFLSSCTQNNDANVNPISSPIDQKNDLTKGIRVELVTTSSMGKIHKQDILLLRDALLNSGAIKVLLHNEDITTLSANEMEDFGHDIDIVLAYGNYQKLKDTADEIAKKIFEPYDLKVKIDVID